MLQGTEIIASLSKS